MPTKSSTTIPHYFTPSKHGARSEQRETFNSNSMAFHVYLALQAVLRSFKFVSILRLNYHQIIYHETQVQEYPTCATPGLATMSEKKCQPITITSFTEGRYAI